MTTLKPHINFNGNAEEAFTFYKSIFGGEFSKIIRFKDIATAEFPVAPSEEKKLMNIVLTFGNCQISGNDVPEFMGKTNENENRSKISVNAESREEANRIFTALSIGGSVEFPMSDSPWGNYFGMFRDKYGIEWMVEYDATS